MISGTASEDKLFECFQNGAKEFITKPIRKHEIRAKVQTVLGEVFEKTRYRQLLESINPKSIAQELFKKSSSIPQ